MPADDIETKITQLCDMDLEGLRHRWRIQFGRSAPKQLTKRLLFRLLAYRIQAGQQGDLSQDTALFLENISNGAGGSVPNPEQIAPGKLGLGTVLMREHGGVKHQVMVVAEGFAWNGATFPNLSQVAKAITGTAWNGPRFFGLRGKKQVELV